MDGLTLTGSSPSEQRSPWVEPNLDAGCTQLVSSQLQTSNFTRGDEMQIALTP